MVLNMTPLGMNRHQPSQGQAAWRTCCGTKASACNVVHRMGHCVTTGSDQVSQHYFPLIWRLCCVDVTPNSRGLLVCALIQCV